MCLWHSYMSDTNMLLLNSAQHKLGEKNPGIATHAKRVRSDFRKKKMWCEFVRVYASLHNSHYYKFKNKNITFIFVTFVNVTDCCSKISANVTSTLIAVSSCALFLSFGTLNSFQMDADGFFLEDVAIVHK